MVMSSGISLFVGISSSWRFNWEEIQRYNLLSVSLGISE